MSRLNPPKKEYEMTEVPRGSALQRPENRAQAPRSSLLIANFQTLKQIQQNEVAAEQSRKTSRLSRGMDPNVPRPKHAPERPKDEKELEEKKMNDKADKIQSMDEHKIPIEELFKRFGTNP